MLANVLAICGAVLANKTPVIEWESLGWVACSFVSNAGHYPLRIVDAVFANDTGHWVDFSGLATAVHCLQCWPSLLCFE